jgi:hypothetical protein
MPAAKMSSGPRSNTGKLTNGLDQEEETQAFGVSSGRRQIGRSASPGRIVAKKSRSGSFNLRQLSTTERIAATLGPACGFPMCIQFLRPNATGRIE